MNTEAIDTLLSKIVDHGATADVLVSSQESLTLKANEGELEEHNVSSSQIIGLRVIKDQRVGLAYSEASDEQSLDELLQQALTNASFGEANAFESIASLGHQLATDDALLAPEDAATTEEKIDFILSLESELRAKDKIQNVPYNQLSDSTSQQFIYSTSGLKAQAKERTIGAGAYALAVDGEVNAMAHHLMYQRRFAELDKAEIIERTYEECIARLSGKPIKTGRYDIIFDPDQQASLFGVFKMALSGRAAKDGLNPWREKLGKQVADSRIQLRDQPLLTDGLAYQLFDDEGTACQECAIITNGALTTLLHNHATANYFNLASTGHAQRSAKSPLGVGAHQLVLTASDADNAQLEQGEVLRISELTGLHSGANAISGDFSFGASGTLYRGGEAVQNVRGITLAGNFYQMLNNIVAFGEQPLWNRSRGSLMAPIRFAQLAVSGS